MVSLLGPVRLRLDAAEQRALGVLVECGLVTEQEAAQAHAVPDLPDWVVESWHEPGETSRGLDTLMLSEVDGRATG